MSDLERDICHERDVDWRRWHMDELAPPRRPAASPSTRDTEAARRHEQQARQAAFEAELETLREQARQAGHEAGYRAGLEAGHAEGHAEGLETGRREAEQELETRLEQTLTPLLPLAEAFSSALGHLDDEVASELVELALATGRQLASDALKTRPRQVLEIVRGLMHTEPPLQGTPRLWLHPLDHKLVAGHLGQELEAAGWALQPDDQVSRGGCRVTSASGELDATWESRWDAVRAQARHRKSGTARGKTS